MEIKDIEGKDLLPGDIVVYVDYNKILKGIIRKIHKSGGIKIDGITRTWTRNIYPGYSKVMIYKL